MKKGILITIIMAFTISLLPTKKTQALTISSLIAPHDVYMYGEVDDQMATAVSHALINADDGNEITLHIISPGGSVYSGLYIVDTMRSLHSPVKTVVESYAMSMAAIIAASGTKGRRFIYPNATMLTHTVSLSCQGHLPEIINCANEAVRLQNIMDSILMKSTGQDLQSVRNMESYDHFISADDSVKLGLVDSII